MPKDLVDLSRLQSSGLASTAGAQAVPSKADQDRVDLIVGKLQAGQPVSKDDLEHLKQFSPVNYQRALAAQAQREAFRHALRACKTKKDVERLQMTIVMDLKSGDDWGTAAVQDEFSTFQGSKEYQKLPKGKEKG